MMLDKSIKVPSAILDIPKIGQLPDHLWRRTIELALLAAMYDKGGELPDADSIAWHLRTNYDDVTRDLEELGKKGIITESIEGELVLKLFNYFGTVTSNASSSTDRVRRYRARRMANGMSASPGYDEEAIKRRDRFECVYCGSNQDLCIDHIYPIILGGTDEYRNLACACTTCNGSKAGRTPKQAGFTFLNKAAEERYLDYLADMEFEIEVS